ncbi:MAG: NAD(P)/FAD-dependent oxidoreductase [Opitutaceae bacterium]
MTTSNTDILIIGAGISGMLCAHELSKTGKTVRILEKGRGFGGRMATRRMAGGRLDHGAQYFTVRDPRFQAYADQWLEAGVIKEWFRKLPEDTNAEGYPRYCGVNGMTDVCKHLAQGLEVLRSELVVELLKDSDQWIVRTDGGNQYSAGHLVITSPIPQSLMLLETTGLDYAGDYLSKLRSVRYDKGLATLAILDGPSGLPTIGAMKVHEAPLTWIADNQVKGISPDVSAVTLHADAEFAAKHWDSPDEIRGQLMLEAAKPYLQASVQEYKCHRWGFTLPVNPLDESHFHNKSLNLTLAGDAFGGPRIEGAALSGIEAAASAR